MARRTRLPIAQDALQPAPVRRQRGDVVKATWTDPDDLTPSAARTARSVAGWRVYDPLRRMLADASSGVTEAHVLAADLFRKHAEVARLGFRSTAEGLYVHTVPEPIAGMSAADRQRVAAAREVDRVLRLFSPSYQRLLGAIVLGNLSLRAWVRLREQTTTRRVVILTESRKLIAILDRLAAHFDAEVGALLERGRLLRP